MLKAHNYHMEDDKSNGYQYSKYMAFIKTIEYGSFTKDAEMLNYSQSGISRMIATLEEWNVSLLDVEVKLGRTPDLGWNDAYQTITENLLRL